MKRRPVGCGLWVTVLCCSLPLLAAAEDVGRLRWQAPSGCPTQHEVERSLARVHAAERLTVDAVVRRAERGYRLWLRVGGAGQRFERELSAGSCELLAESAVFFVELAGAQLTAAGTEPNMQADSAPETAPGVDAEPRGSRAADLSESRGSEAASPEPELVSSGLPETTHRAPRDARAAADGGDGALSNTWNLRLGFGAAMIEAGLSDVTPHLALELSLARARWSVGLRLGALLHPALRIAERAAVDLQTNAAQLVGCRYWDVAGVLIGPCLGLSALRSSAESTGLTGQQRSGATWLTVGPALQLQLRVMRSVLLGIELGAWAAITPRPSFEVGGNTVARAGTLAGYARLGAAYELW